ncbi:MAG: YqaJ viral recombinase family protein [Oscillospiraceae bacterium]|nr:YqaJ viral recombinase family protein [Oscillospiraceae bacterium]
MAAIVLTSTENLSREQWLAYRNLGIGGSDASVVCGVNKYKSPLELWMEKTGKSPQKEAGEPAYWGTRLESLIRNEFTLRTGIKVITVNQMLQSKEYPFMLANLDGVCRCPTHGKCVFEAKTANAFKAEQWASDLVPQEYILQLQHYLCVTGYSGAYIAVLVGGNAFQWKFVPRDEEIISMLIRYERDFWMHVQDGVPIPPDGSKACSEFISQQYPNSIAQSKILLPDSAADLIRRHNEADGQMEMFKVQKQEAANLLKQMLGEHEMGVVGDGYVKWKTSVQNRIDSKLLEAEQPEIFAKYKMAISQRRFTVKEPTSTYEHEDGYVQDELQLRKAG